MPKKYNRESFIKEAREVHDQLYDYSKVIYVGSKIDIIIICKKHGEFLQRPHSHLNGAGCHKCAYHQ
jgi:hypothetical protein